MAEVEPLICQFCIRLGKMGQPLTKKTIIEFANSIISKTEYQDKVEAAKELRGLEDESKLGVRWYQGFLNRHAYQWYCYQGFQKKDLGNKRKL